MQLNGGKVQGGEHRIARYSIAFKILKANIIGAYVWCVLPVSVELFGYSSFSRCMCSIAKTKLKLLDKYMRT